MGLAYREWNNSGEPRMPGLRETITDHKSAGLCSMGVPVRATRWFAWRGHTAFAAREWSSFAAFAGFPRSRWGPSAVTGAVVEGLSALSRQRTRFEDVAYGGRSADGSPAWS